MRERIRVGSAPVLLAAALGLVTVAGFAAFAAWQGRIVSGAAGLPFGLAWLAPYGVALAAAFVRRREVRWPLVLGAGLGSLGQAIFWLPWGVFLIPTAFLLLVQGFALTMSAAWSRRETARLVATFAAGACLVGALYLGYLRDDPRCWERRIFPDGTEERRPVAVAAARELGGRLGPVRIPVERDPATGALVVPHCLRDVLTPFDVALALSATGAGLAVLGAAAALGRRAALARQAVEA